VQHSRLPFEKAWRPPSAENAVSAVNRSGYLVQPSSAEDASHASPGKAIPPMTTKSPPSDSTLTRFRIPCPSSIAYIGHAPRDQLALPPSLQIGHATRDLFVRPSVEAGAWRPGEVHPDLSWTHYRTLLKVERRDVRDFYEIESIKHGWSARQLERQIGSMLFERLLKSPDKEGVLALANAGLEPRKAADIIKDPYVLEFLDLPESNRLLESDLETALISRLQDFLLELGSGFAFIGRQVRITLDGDHFYPDLVFYHVKLKCFVVIDLKVAPLTHGDLGQMQMYVHYYDREVVAPDDNPTIGLVLCTAKNDAMVQYVLDDKSRQIFASRYQFQLPSEETLKNQLEREMKALQDEGSPSS
jgi:predicted nuclease of restriction endonuclease-like (RecB) superfamily